MNSDNKYYCELCDYSTDKKSNFSNHEKSKKHLIKINGDICVEVIAPRNNDMELKLKEQEIHFTNIINKLTIEVEVLKARLECKDEFIEFLKSQPVAQVVTPVIQVPQQPTQTPQSLSPTQSPIPSPIQSPIPSPPPVIIKKKTVKPTLESKPQKEESIKLTITEELNQTRESAYDNQEFLNFFKDDSYNENYVEVIEDSSGNDMVILKKARLEEYPPNFEKVVLNIIETVIKNVEPNDRPIFYDKKNKEFFLKEKGKWINMCDSFITKMIKTVYGNLCIAHINTRQNIKQLYKHFGFSDPTLFLKNEDAEIRLLFTLFESNDTGTETIDKSLDPKFIEKVKSVLKVCME
jgi:hypothetical protein